MFTYKVAKIEFNDGHVFDTHDTDVVLIVGPNNSGKTKALQEIGDSIQKPIPLTVIKKTEIVQEGSYSEFLDWVSYYYPTRKDKEPNAIVVPINSKNELIFRFNESQFGKGLSQLHNFGRLVNRLHDASWLQFVRRTNGIEFYEEAFLTPIHILQRLPDIKEKVSRETFLAFGFHVSPDMRFSGEIRLRKGQEPIGVVNQLSSEYQSALRSLPDVDSEGSGVRGYISCLLCTIVGQYKIVLIDEPELFLHPPQARRLGKTIAENASLNGQQIIAVTHCSDFIMGVLSGSQNVSIIRLERADDINRAYSLNSNNIKEFWNDPILKSSNAIRGLFHEGIIVCEADTDIRFYEGILHVLESQGKLEKPADVYFVHGGGKGKLATLAHSYKQLYIPTAVIADFDLLRQKGEFIKTFETLGGRFSDIEGLYNSAMNDLSQSGSLKSAIDVVQELKGYLQEIELVAAKNGKILSDHRKKIFKLLEDGRDWGKAKQKGKGSVERGALLNLENLLQRLNSVGLFLVPIGELESWDRRIVMKDKTDWLNQALEKLANDTSSFAEAKEFVHNVIHYLWLNPRITE